MAANALYPSPQASDGFLITPSDTLNIKDDPNNYRRVESVFLHNIAAGATVRVMPAGKPLPHGFTLTGSSGTANINVNGRDYLATFNSSLPQTASDFVSSHAAALAALGITVTQMVGTALLVFTGVQAANLTITNASGNLNGTTLSRVPLTVFIEQGDVFPLAVSRVYASTPTPPAGLVGLFGGSR